MRMETYRVYRDIFPEQRIITQIITEHPDLTVDFLKTIKGLEFKDPKVSYTVWHGKTSAVLTITVTKGLPLIPRIIPPYTDKIGAKWTYWRTVDRLAKRQK